MTDMIYCRYCNEFFDYEIHRESAIILRYGKDSYRWICGNCVQLREVKVKIRRWKSKERKEEFKKMCEEYGNICPCCGEKKKLTIDHIVPISKGGSDDIDNIQPLCSNCNNKKSNKHSTRYKKDI